MTPRPLRLSIHALGGQGGGVLAEWLVDLSEGAGWIAQATSVPGVAQRTGATIYYVELSPLGAHEPVMALMPTPGDVDIVLAAELMEAGRAIARGLVTPERTTLIASTHRLFAIGEKSAMGDGIVSSAAVLQAAARNSKRFIAADLADIAEREGSAISAALFGALAGSGALPFSVSAFEATITAAGKGVEPSLRAFRAALSLNLALAPSSPQPRQRGEAASAPAALPERAQYLMQLGVERLKDYQGTTYADLYLTRLAAVSEADRALGGDGALTEAAARHLALWMAYEDGIRVADLKTRAQRFERVGREARAPKDRVLHVTEFMHPRFEELCDLMPVRIGHRMLHSARARRWLAPLTRDGRFFTTTRLSGFLPLWLLARTRRWRHRTLRYFDEQARIEAWLETAINAARSDYAAGVEVIRLQRLVKGYGETHARGLSNFAAIVNLLPALLTRRDAAEQIAGLQRAALADDESLALTAAIAALAQARAPLETA